jgi:hypothetical protein
MRAKRRLVSLISMMVLITGTAVAVAAPPAAAATGCTKSSVRYGYQTYNCYMYRSSVRLWMHTENYPSEYRLHDNTSAVLYQGTSWFVCQRRFVNVQAYYGSAANDWWAYTLSDNGLWGWASAVHISGGSNWGGIPGLAGCSSGFANNDSWPTIQRRCSNINIPGPDFSRIDIGGRVSRTYIGC